VEDPACLLQQAITSTPTPLPPAPYLLSATGHEDHTHYHEFSDLEQTPAGVALMLALTTSYVIHDDATALAWLERLLPVEDGRGRELKHGSLPPPGRRSTAKFG